MQRLYIIYLVLHGELVMRRKKSYSRVFWIKYSVNLIIFHIY